MVHADDPDFPGDDDYGREADWTSFSRKLEGLVPDSVMRKAAGAFKGVLQTEEGVRSVLGEVSREVIDHAREQIDKGKGELVTRVAKEFRDFLEKTDVSGEVKKILTEIQLEVKTEVRFVEREDGELEAQTTGVRTKSTGKKSPRTPRKKKTTS